MKNSCILTVAMLYSFCFCIAQPLFVKKVYLLSPSPYTTLTSNFLLPATDNTILDIGTSGSLSTISKFDSTGNWRWTKSFQVASANLNAFIAHAAEYPDSTLAITGLVHDINYYGNFTAFCAKLKSNGDTMWCRAFTNADAITMIPHGLCATVDSGLVICGQAITSGTVSGPDAHAFVARFTKNGNLSWLKTLSTSFYGSNAYSIKQTADSGFVIAGELHSGAGVNLCATVIKLNKAGNIIWHKKYCEVNSGGVDGVALDITEEKSGYLCVINSGSDIIFLRIDLEGKELNSKKYLNTQAWYTSSYVRPLNFRKLSPARRQLTFSGDFMSSWTLVLDTLGNVQWQASANLANIDAVELKNKSQALIGNRQTVIDGAPLGPGDIGIIITDSLGSSNGECYIRSVFTTTTVILDSTTISSNFITGGVTSPISVTINAIPLRVDSGCMLNGVGFKENSLAVSRLYPNPSKGRITLLAEALPDKSLTVSFSDLTGRVLLVKEIVPGKNVQELDLGEFPPALYFCTFTINSQVIKVEKLVISD